MTARSAPGPVSKMDCCICSETVSRLGYECECKNDICIPCQARLDKCPFCRREYPGMVARMAALGGDEEVLRAYAAVLDDQRSEELKRDEFCAHIVEMIRCSFYHPVLFQEIYLPRFEDDSRMYVQIIKQIEQDFIDAYQNKVLDAAFHIAMFLNYFHHSEVELSELVCWAEETGEVRQEEYNRQHNRLVIQGRKHAKPRVFEKKQFSSRSSWKR